MRATSTASVVFIMIRCESTLQTCCGPLDGPLRGFTDDLGLVQGRPLLKPWQVYGSYLLLQKVLP